MQSLSNCVEVVLGWEISRLRFFRDSCKRHDGYFSEESAGEKNAVPPGLSKEN